MRGPLHVEKKGGSYALHGQRTLKQFCSFRGCNRKIEVFETWAYRVATMNFCCTPPKRRGVSPAGKRKLTESANRRREIEDGRLRVGSVSRRFPSYESMPLGESYRAVRALLYPAALILVAADYAAGARLPIEVSRTISVIEKSEQVKREIRRLDELVSPGREIRPFIADPKGRCLCAMFVVGSLLHEANYKTEYRVMWIWDDAGSSIRNHAVVLATIDGVTYFVDVTAHQFLDLGIDYPIIDAEHNAMARYLSSGAVLIKYRDFPTPERAKAFAYFFGGEGRATDRVDGATVVRPFPEWYEPDAI